MADHEASRASTTGGLPVAPSLGPALDAAHVPHQAEEDKRRIVFISGISIGIAFCAGILAAVLTRLIGLITNAAFYGRLSTDFVSPADNTLGALVIIVPVLGAVIVGIMARYGSSAIRGHGIPEAMEQVLYNESRISPRLTILKPLSAAISIGTGGPFGAEGPIIATGGALGSLVGQLLHITADERKILLSAGAAERRRAYRVHPARRAHWRRVGVHHARRLRHRGRVRPTADPLDVVARTRRGGGGSGRVHRAAHAGRGIRQH